MLTTKLMWTLCSDVEGACFKVVKRAWTKSLCSLEFFFLLDLFSNFFLEECSSLIPFCFPLFIMLKVMMTIRDAYLLSGSQWGDILFEGEFLFLHVKLSQFIKFSWFQNVLLVSSNQNLKNQQKVFQDFCPCL